MSYTPSIICNPLFSFPTFTWLLTPDNSSELLFLHCSCLSLDFDPHRISPRVWVLDHCNSLHLVWASFIHCPHRNEWPLKNSCLKSLLSYSKFPIPFSLLNKVLISWYRRNCLLKSGSLLYIDAHLPFPPTMLPIHQPCNSLDTSHNLLGPYIYTFILLYLGCSSPLVLSGELLLDFIESKTWLVVRHTIIFYQ